MIVLCTLYVLQEAVMLLVIAIPLVMYFIALAQKVCKGSIIHSSKGTFQHMHNCKQRGGKCCADNKEGTLNAKRATNSQSYCGYCFN